MCTKNEPRDFFDEGYPAPENPGPLHLLSQPAHLVNTADLTLKALELHNNLFEQELIPQKIVIGSRSGGTKHFPVAGSLDAARQFSIGTCTQSAQARERQDGCV